MINWDIVSAFFSRPLWRPGTVASFSSIKRFSYGTVKATAATWGEAQEDLHRLPGPLEDGHPPADHTAAHGKREPETGGWVIYAQQFKKNIHSLCHIHDDFE